ncbi:mariner transposase [Trichonephila clavipes]|nr:mariner transposase [Trichonephila clavipes]
MMDRIPICKFLPKRNEIDTFLKRMVTGEEKWMDNIVGKRLWSKSGEAAQMGIKPGLTARKVLPCICFIISAVERRLSESIGTGHRSDIRLF